LSDSICSFDQSDFFVLTTRMHMCKRPTFFCAHVHIAKQFLCTKFLFFYYDIFKYEKFDCKFTVKTFYFIYPVHPVHPFKLFTDFRSPRLPNIYVKVVVTFTPYYFWSLGGFSGWPVYIMFQYHFKMVIINLLNQTHV